MVADEMKAKSQESIKSIIGAVTPLSVIGATITNLINRGIDALADFSMRIFNAKQSYAELGKQVDKTAKDLGTSTEQAARLEAAAKAAGVGANDYAKAMEDIKSGKTTLEEQAEAWLRDNFTPPKT